MEFSWVVIIQKHIRSLLMVKLLEEDMVECAIKMEPVELIRI